MEPGQTQKLSVAVVLCLLLLATEISLSPKPSAAGLSKPSASTEKATSADFKILSQTSAALNEVAQKALPAVVAIMSIRQVPPHMRLGLGEEANPGPWDTFDGNPAPRIPARRERGITVGSGVIIDPRGYILTNHHVIEDSERITVTFDETHRLPAHLVGDDPSTDLAVIKLETAPPGRIATLDFGDSEAVKVGDWAIAIGSPFGLKRTVTMGIISAKGRGKVGMLDTEDFLQTDAALNPGSSGGPLLNIHGDIIGLNTAIYSQTGAFIGIGFAVPSKIAKEISVALIDHGHVSRGWVGMSAQDLDEPLSRYFNAPLEQGALVTQVLPGGPADQASLQAGDVILSFDQRQVAGSIELKHLVASGRLDRPVEIRFLRDGRVKSTELRLHEQPAPARAQQLAGRISPGEDDFGATIHDLIPELARFLKLPPGAGALVTEVRPGSAAFDAGLSPGDVVLRADSHLIHNARELATSMRSLRKNRPSVLYVQRGPLDTGEKLFIPLPPFINSGKS